MNDRRGILLDTHIWVRLQGVSRKLSREALREIRRATATGTVFVSAISIWELAMLEARNRLGFDLPIRQWVKESLEKPGIELLPLTPEIAIESVQLPEPMHKDPADRIVLASAKVERLTLITCDRSMLRFARHIGLECVEG